MKCLYPIAEHTVHRFVMPVIRSNMYLLIHGTEALVIDPHISEEAEALIAEAGVQECVVLLTHEHFDHISGVNWLRGICSCRVICTRTCAEMIESAKKNAASVFGALFLVGHSESEQKEIEPFLAPDYTCKADFAYDREWQFDWHGISVTLKEMQGHSKGSQLILLEDGFVLTGDNLVPGEKTVTRLPGGSRRILEETVQPYLRALPKSYIVYPGHGDPGYLSEGKMQCGLKMPEA